jgi:hypothetical protein
LVSIDLEDGEEQWRASNVARVIASSAHRVYVRDRFGRLVILDAGNGRRLGSFMAQEINYSMPNSQNDRLYLASAGGLVQCLRESDQPEPLVFAPPPAVAEVPAPAPGDGSAAKMAPVAPKAAAGGGRAGAPRASPRRAREPQEVRADRADRADRNERGPRGRAGRTRGRGGQQPDGLPGAANGLDDENPAAERRGRAARARPERLEDGQLPGQMPGPPRRGPANDAFDAPPGDALDDVELDP